MPDVPSKAAEIFKIVAKSGVNVDMIVQNVSEAGITDISFTVPADGLEASVAIAERVAPEIGADGVTYDPSIAKVSLVGAGMKTNPGVAATVFETLAAHHINIEMISTSAIRISCVVAGEECDAAVAALHTAFGLDLTS